MLSAITVPFDHKYCRIVKYTIKSTNQRGIFIEKFAPFICPFIAGKYHGMGIFLVVSAVNDIEKHASVFFLLLLQILKYFSNYLQVFFIEFVVNCKLYLESTRCQVTLLKS